jgi:hypothetical protein
MDPYKWNFMFLFGTKFQFFFSGMAFGTGSAVAHRAVDAVMGPRTIQHEAVVNEAAAAAPAPTASSFGGDACNYQSKAFQDVSCLSSSVIS